MSSAERCSALYLIKISISQMYDCKALQKKYETNEATANIFAFFCLHIHFLLIFFLRLAFPNARNHMRLLTRRYLAIYTFFFAVFLLRL